MSMNRKFQVFVSSTFVDLEDERRAVIEAILDLGHIPIGMEAFQAGNEEQWNYIKKRIDECDYYVVILAERYGSEKDGVSYTEMEYDYAREKGVPVAAFLLAPDARIDWRAAKAKFIDNVAKIDAFRAKCEGLMVRHWKNKDDLSASLVKSLSHLITNCPRDGWIPAKEAMNPDVANELARLIKENEALKEKLSNENDSNNFDLIAADLYNKKIESRSGNISNYVDVLIGMSKQLSIGYCLSGRPGSPVYIETNFNFICLSGSHRYNQHIFPNSGQPHLTRSLFVPICEARKSGDSTNVAGYLL